MAATSGIEHFLNSYVQKKEVSAIYVTDLQGRIIIEVPSEQQSSQLQDTPIGQETLGGGETVDLTAATTINENMGVSATASDGLLINGPTTSNAIISGSMAFRFLSQLKKQAEHIAIQYADYTLVQFTHHGVCMVTLIGRRGENHTLGALLALVPAIKGSPVFRDMSSIVKDAIETNASQQI